MVWDAPAAFADGGHSGLPLNGAGDGGTDNPNGPGGNGVDGGGGGGAGVTGGDGGDGIATYNGGAGGAGGSIASKDGADGSPGDAGTTLSGGGGGGGGAAGLVGSTMGGTGGNGGNGGDSAAVRGRAGGGGGGGYGVILTPSASSATYSSDATGGDGGDGGEALNGSGGDGGDGGVGVYLNSTNVSVTFNGNELGGTGGNGGSVSVFYSSDPPPRGAGGDGGDAIQASQASITIGGQALGGTGGNGATIGAASGGNGGIGISGSSLTITNTNTGAIQGGDGGQRGPSGSYGKGGAGIAGANLTVINSGAISGGFSGDGGTQANAITFTGGTNSLELRAGSSIAGNVVANSTADTLKLGGATDSNFDASAIGGQYQGFGLFEKTGSSTWTLTGTTAAVTPWTIDGGTLNVSSDGALGAPTSALTLDGGTLQLGASFDLSASRATTITANGGTIDTNGNDSTFAQDIGGAGALTKIGAGTLILSGTNTYGGSTTINAGTLQLGDGGTTGSIAGDITNNATLAVNRSNTFTYDGAISGTGAFEQNGTGKTVLTGINTYTGPTTVNAGKLVVNGSIANSTVTVRTGGTLGGSGQLGALTVNGTLAPGNSIGTMTVNGAFVLGAGAVYEVEVDAAGNSDKVIVNGTVNLTGATLKVLAADGNYQTTTDYTIIENDGSDAVKGKFGSVSTNLAFLTPSVAYAAGDGNDVVLTLERNETLFPDVARTRNQRAVAGALSRFPTNNALYLAVLNQTAEGARTAFDALSGEVHATVAGTLVDDSRYAREAVLGRMMQASHSGEALGSGGPQVASRGATYDADAMRLGSKFVSEEMAAEPVSQPLAFWTQGYGAWGTFDTDGNAATADRNLGGFISGMDASIGGSWRVGVATGAAFSNVSVDERYSGANTKTYHLGGYVNGDVGGFALRGGGLWAWSDIETSRAVVFPNFYERQKADYDADTAQLFGEVAYPTQVAGVEVEPFGGLAYVSLESGGFREKGGAQASLRSSGIDQDVGYTTVGLRAAQTMMWGDMAVTPHIEAAWLHAFDDVTPGTSLAFATTGIGFSIDGVPLAEDSALLDAGVDFALSDRVSAGVSYQGQFADSLSDNAVKGRLTWLFN